MRCDNYEYILHCKEIDSLLHHEPCKHTDMVIALITEKSACTKLEML